MDADFDVGQIGVLVFDMIIMVQFGFKATFISPIFDFLLGKNICYFVHSAFLLLDHSLDGFELALFDHVKPIRLINALPIDCLTSDVGGLFQIITQTAQIGIGQKLKHSEVSQKVHVVLEYLALYPILCTSIVFLAKNGKVCIAIVSDLQLCSSFLICNQCKFSKTLKRHIDFHTFHN